MHGEPRPGAPSSPGRADPDGGHDPSVPFSRAGFFEGLPDGALSRLAELARRRTFTRGAVLMRQGDPSESLHLLVSGRVRVERSHPSLTAPVFVAELGPGEVVGE